MNLSLPLNFIDVGGFTSKENEEICKNANGAIIICGETAMLSGAGSEWKIFFDKLRIPVVAEIYSDYYGSNDYVEGIGEDGIFRASIHHLERGEKLYEREAAKALAHFVVTLGSVVLDERPEN